MSYGRTLTRLPASCLLTVLCCSSQPYHNRAVDLHQLLRKSPLIPKACPISQLFTLPLSVSNRAYIRLGTWFTHSSFSTFTPHPIPFIAKTPLLFLSCSPSWALPVVTTLLVMVSVFFLHLSHFSCRQLAHPCLFSSFSARTILPWQLTQTTIL